ncbi:hypothetical protein OROGR_026137 [Orobanche gracilis]
MAAALQQTPITSNSGSTPASQTHSKPTTRLSLPSNLKLPKINIKTFRRRMVHSVAERYANALADLARSNNTLNQTSADMENIDQIFSEEQLLAFFTNPTVRDENKREILDEIVKLSSLQTHVANFLNILVDMKRIDLIRDIAKDFEVAYNKLTDTELAIVTSVVRLESQHLAQIAKEVQKLTGARNVRIKTVLDSSMVAGFTIRYGSSGSKLIDMSVKKQLEEIAALLETGDTQLAV